MFPWTATGPEVYVSTTATVISNYYDGMEDTLNKLKSIKLNSCPVYSITHFCAIILVDCERIDSDRGFKPDKLGYITCIFEDNSDSRFNLWEMQNY